MTTKAARTATAMCPLRPGEPCMLCQPGGPESCGLVYLVMTDPVLRDELAQRRRERPARIDIARAA